MAYIGNNEIRLAPSEIRFTQDTIGHTFTHGGSVNEAIKKIERGLMKASDFPKIRVCIRDNKYYSLDNRRLYVFRVLEKRGKLRQIDVIFVSDKFTTNNDGYSIYMRGYKQRTYEHTFERLRSYSTPSRPSSEKAVSSSQRSSTLKTYNEAYSASVRKCKHEEHIYKLGSSQNISATSRDRTMNSPQLRKKGSRNSFVTGNESFIPAQPRSDVDINFTKPRLPNFTPRNKIECCIIS